MSEGELSDTAPSPSNSNAKNEVVSNARIYGVTLKTDLQFVAPVLPSSNPPELRVSAASDPISFDGTTRLYSGPPIERGEASDSGLYRRGRSFIFRFADLVDFQVTPDQVTYRLRKASYAYAVEIGLLGTVMSFWLEWQGRPALHASAVAINGCAVGFIASNRGGKSSLAAALMQRGASLLTDDILALDQAKLGRHAARRDEAENVKGPEESDNAIRGEGGVHAYPGYPQMRMWPDQAGHFAPDRASLTPVHPYIEKKRVPVGNGGVGAFCEELCPVRGLYLPERRDDVDVVDIRPVPPGEAVIELVRGSFVAPLIEEAGWQARRLPLLARIAERVPVRRLIYPNGTEHLSGVAHKIEKDISMLSH